MALVRKNKRHNGDLLIKSKNFLALVSSLVLLSVVILLALAKPKGGTMFDRFYNTGTGFSMWNASLVEYSFFLMIPLAICSVVGLIINSKRHKRKNDRYSMALVISLIASLLGMIILQLFFM
ncbi:MAG: hypothetical protein GY754_28755 [bacterium]|nr:hypothetical protein [bacterium]